MLIDYYAMQGPRAFFATWGGLNVALILCGLRLYVYGKRICSWAMRHNVLLD